MSSRFTWFALWAVVLFSFAGNAGADVTLSTQEREGDSIFNVQIFNLLSFGDIGKDYRVFGDDSFLGGKAVSDAVTQTDAEPRGYAFSQDQNFHSVKVELTPTVSFDYIKLGWALTEIPEGATKAPFFSDRHGVIFTDTLKINGVAVNIASDAALKMEIMLTDISDIYNPGYELRYSIDGEGYLTGDFSGLDSLVLGFDVYDANGFNIDIGFYEAKLEETVTPEPATLLMFGAGLAGLALARRRNSKR